MTYTIIASPNPQELMNRVNEGISQGWHPIGGLCVASNVTGQSGTIKSVPEYYQAMAKD